ncbi:MAG: hypothetical protein HY517_01240 [Candidatus Aenigmarchaeota archaeon]|nr:hypothetical protein [Candidatus Aenigmarchaeota archaeon]
MLVPGYYLRQMRMDGSKAIPKEIFVHEYFRSQEDAERRSGELNARHGNERGSLYFETVCIDRQRATMSVQHASRVFRLSVRTLYSWMGEGAIEYVRTPAGSRRILVDSPALVRRLRAREEEYRVHQIWQDMAQMK